MNFLMDSIKQFSFDKNSLFEKCYSIDPTLGISGV